MARGNSTRRNKAFDLPFAPSNRLEANRWLNKATFGPATSRVDLDTATKTNITLIVGEEDDADKLMRIGYSAYVNEQMSDNTIVSSEVADPQINSNRSIVAFNSWWFGNAIHSSAAIRFKSTFALSQIFAAKRSAGVDYTQQLKYYDFLLKSTLSTNTSSFRTLLTDVTHSQLMGAWLTYNDNRKANSDTFQKPDENYAREILQLFTIGLNVLNLDGTNKLDSAGNPIPTYNNEDVRQLAKVFTGLYNRGAGLTRMQPQEPDGIYHDMEAKILLPYPDGSTSTIPAQTVNTGHILENPINPAGYLIESVLADEFRIRRTNPNHVYQYGNGANIFYKTSATGPLIQANSGNPINNPQSPVYRVQKTAHGLVAGDRVWLDSPIETDINMALDWIFNHPNVGPFIAKSFIKLMVCSNPSPQYVRRVATIFNNNGSGVRGDISAVINAMLLDREAVLPFGVNPRNFGKYTTVLDKILKSWRAFRNDTISYQVEIEHEFASRKDMRLRSAITKPRNLLDFGAFPISTNNIMPFQTPSVFNFFRPGFVPPGTELGNIGLTAPELQLVNIDSQTSWSNIVAAACETLGNQEGLTDTPGSNSVDVRTGAKSVFGLDFNPDPAGWTVTSVNLTSNLFTATGRLNTVITVGGNNDLLFIGFANRTKGNRLDMRFRGGFIVGFVGGTGGSAFLNDQAEPGGESLRRPAVGINQTIRFTAENPSLVAVGDIIDVISLQNCGRSGIGASKFIDGNGALTDYPQKGNITVFHKVAGMIPNTTTVTSADLTPAINYLESILLSSQMSNELKGIVTSAGLLTVTDTIPNITGDAVFENHYLNLVMNKSQKRARHMIAMILASPEFQINR